MGGQEAESRNVAGGKIVRHNVVDRLMHWLFAVSVLILLGTSFLPILGIKFEWVTIHWITGLILMVAINASRRA